MKNLLLRKTLKTKHFIELFGKEGFVLDPTGVNGGYHGARFVRLDDGKYIDFIWKTKYTFEIEIGQTKVRWSNDESEWWCASSQGKPILITSELNHFDKSLSDFIDYQIGDIKILREMVL